MSCLAYKLVEESTMCVLTNKQRLYSKDTFRLELPPEPSTRRVHPPILDTDTHVSHQYQLDVTRDYAFATKRVLSAQV